MFDYQKFDVQCSTMTTEELLKQHHHYSKLSAASMTSTAVSALSIPLTLGLSGVAIGMSVPAHHNAKKKKQIVEKYLKARGIEGQQAAQYANALAYDQQQKQCWEQAQLQQSTSSRSQSPAMNDHKHDYSHDKEKKYGGGGPSRSNATPPPPPTYDESLAGPQGYMSQGYNQQQQQSYGAPQQGWNQNQNQYQAGYGAPQGWGQPQMGYGMPPQQQMGWGQPQQQQGYGGNQSTMYPNSAMCAGQSSDGRHVHFARESQLATTIN